MEACKATRRLIKRAIQTCRPSIVGKEALEHVNRREVGEQTNKRPFYARQKDKTIRKYSDHWVKVLRYVWRTHLRASKPLYTLTPRQSQCMQSIKASCNRDDEETSSESSQGGSRADIRNRRQRIEDGCLSFWIAMLDHELKAGEYKSGMMSGLAVLGFNTQKGGWMPATNYTPILSAIVMTARTLVIYSAHKEQEDEVQGLRGEGLEEQDAKAEAPSVYALVRGMVHRFMTLIRYDGEPTPMNRILRLRTYGFRIRYDTHAEGKVLWEGDKLLIDKISFTMADLRSMVQGLYETVRMQLWKELLFLDVDESGNIRPGTTQLPKLELDRLSDNLCERMEGWSFLHDTRNTFDVDGKRWLFKRALAEERLKKQFIRREQDATGSARDIPWRGQGVRDYMQQIRRFKERLFVLAHMTGGAPARGTEVVSVQCENGVNGRGTRGVFVGRGLVSFVTSYHKGYSASKKVKVVHRYVPREVSEMVVYYLWLVQPFARIVQMLHERQGEFKEFSWEPEAEEEWSDDEEEEEEEEEDDDDDNDNGEEGRVDPAVEWSDGEGEDNEETERQRREDQRPSSPDGFWGTDRVRAAMQKETSARMGARMSTGIYRHAYPAIHRELTQDKGVARTLDSIYEGKEKGDGDDDVRARQAGHGKCMEEMIYGRALTESPFHTVPERQGFCKVSTDWHRILHFPSAWVEGHVDPETRRPMQVEQEQEEFRRWRTLRKTDLTRPLKQMMR